ncbi:MULTISPECIES: 23S rRNA (cytidine(2498)-2'-O)-methyltransferase RlmM [unclassified Thioalkalivibrio]|uniref:23S rRNA (cytidine(2498)-2'-O)-methyltransferase RlmM n=1 Tax=unclassified Thioalkalivibrio TaxID=2621013 RepID=UPI0003798144|nr:MULTISPECIES: 23S rRNA (cytidine(2498)-2'-O)-methyltransferase RlmM [unclassified Thioalkalivibrio]
MEELLFYCRAGFEKDLAGELAAEAAREGLAVYPRFVEGTAFVRLLSADGDPAPLRDAFPLDERIFARQRLPALHPLEGLSRKDRVSPVVERIRASGWSFEAIWHETPDTNEGKELRRLGKALERPLDSALRKAGALRGQGEAQGRRLHCFWTAGDRVQLGLAAPESSSDRPGGILRLKAPRAAPSRSALKLEEAWFHFLTPEEREQRLAEGMTAVDLGAAPGGWTWQLVRHGLHVQAVDNGPMDADLMAGGQVEHIREDAFTWMPPRPVHWLVCDIVDRPGRVSERIGDWLEAGWAEEAIFNLKLPMKKRYETVRECLDRLEGRLVGYGFRLRARQLYHDREEITVHARPARGAAGW